MTSPQSKSERAEIFKALNDNDVQERCSQNNVDFTNNETAAKHLAEIPPEQFVCTDEQIHTRIKTNTAGTNSDATQQHEIGTSNDASQQYVDLTDQQPEKVNMAQMFAARNMMRIMQQQNDLFRESQNALRESQNTQMQMLRESQENQVQMRESQNNQMMRDIIAQRNTPPQQSKNLVLKKIQGIRRQCKDDTIVCFIENFETIMNANRIDKTKWPDYLGTVLTDKTQKAYFHLLSEQRKNYDQFIAVILESYSCTK